MKAVASSILRNSSFLIFLTAAALTSAAFSINGNKDNYPFDETNKKYGIPFRLVNNKIILSVKIGETRPLRAILDSGMGWDGLLILNSNLKDSVKLENPKNANIGGAGKEKASTAVFADSMSFSIGDIKFKNQRVVILNNDNFKGSSSDAVVGYSLLGHSAVEVDFDKLTIILHDPEKLNVDSSWEALPISFKNSIPWIDVKVVIDKENPVDLSCYIDCASSEAVEFLLKPDQKFSVPEETKEVHLGTGLSGDIYGKTGKIAKVILGSYELKNVLAAFAPSEVRSKQKGADAVIANNLLRRFNLIYDYPRQKLYIKPNSHFTDPF